VFSVTVIESDRLADAIYHP